MKLVRCSDFYIVRVRIGSGSARPLEQVQRLVAGAFAAQAVEAGVGEEAAGGQGLADGGAAALGPHHADRRAAMRAALVPALAGRGLGRVGQVVDGRHDFGAFGPRARIAEVFLAVNPHLGALLRVGARDSRQGLRLRDA